MEPNLDALVREAEHLTSDPQALFAFESVSGTGAMQIADWVRNLALNLRAARDSLTSGVGMDGRSISRHQVAAGLERMTADYRSGLARLRGVLDDTAFSHLEQFLARAADVAAALRDIPRVGATSSQATSPTPPTLPSTPSRSAEPRAGAAPTSSGTVGLAGETCRACRAPRSPTHWTCPRCGDTLWGMVVGTTLAGTLVASLGFLFAPTALRWILLVTGGVFALVGVGAIVAGVRANRQRSARDRGSSRGPPSQVVG